MFYRLIRAFALFGSFAAPARDVSAQDTTSLTLPRARALARAASPDLAAARHAVEAARGRASQAGAFINPVLSYGREQTGRDGEAASQEIVAIDQTIEAPGVRRARRDAARIRINLAQAHLRGAEAELDLDVTRAYAQAIAARRRASLADQIARTFATAAAVSERRLREGDISGFAARRIRLEAARYAALRGEAVLASGTARFALATLTSVPIGSPTELRTPIPDSAIGAMLVSSDSLGPLALRSRPEIDVAALEVDVANMETRFASRERFPAVTLSMGIKREEVIGGDQHSGFIAGLGVPLPLWDRRRGVIGATQAEVQRRSSKLSGAQRTVIREVTEAVESFRAVQEQLGVLGPALQADAATALRSGQAAYVEGELTLIEWLDTVRAYYETETTVANLRSELLIRAAMLDRAVGTSFIKELR